MSASVRAMSAKGDDDATQRLRSRSSTSNCVPANAQQFIVVLNEILQIRRILFNAPDFQAGGNGTNTEKLEQDILLIERKQRFVAGFDPVMSGGFDRV